MINTFENIKKFMNNKILTYDNSTLATIIYCKWMDFSRIILWLVGTKEKIKEKENLQQCNHLNL